MSEKDDLRKRIAALEDHSPEEIRIAAEQLKKLEFSFNLGNMEYDLFGLKRKDVLKIIDKIDGYDFKKLVDTRNIEPEYEEGGDKTSWAEQAKTSRIRLIVTAYLLLHRLRSDEPEAWDEVNELYFDD